MFIDKLSSLLRGVECEVEDFVALIYVVRTLHIIVTFISGSLKIHYLWGLQHALIDIFEETEQHRL